MSELRQDILTGEWVIFATNRKKRPYDFVKQSIPKELNYDCQFCPNHEDLTPNALYQNGEDGKWNIRVFENMFPAVSKENKQCNEDEFYNAAAGYGFHEVLVDTPEHEGIIHDFTIEHIVEVLKTLQYRFNEMKCKKGIQYVQIFKNCGPDAGASINHSHWQIMGIGIIPKEQSQVYQNEKNYFEEKHHCLICDMVRHELSKDVRIISENEHFIAFAPYASKMSYEIWITSKDHVATYADFNIAQLTDMGEILKQILFRVKEVREGISYNICFQDMPTTEELKDHYHWYARILPRMGNPAGFEFATGCYINPILPEATADFFKKLNVDL